MSVDAVDSRGVPDDVPERLVPLELKGRLIEGEQLARYRWAAMMTSGKRVLDAGCGLAYGTKMLAEAGAQEVVGLDLATAVLDSVRPDMPAKVRLEVGDIRQLPYEHDRFDLVVCFEVIEHLDDPRVALDELTRVLAPDGLLLLSSPNRDGHPAREPYRRHEADPQKLVDEVSRRFRNVRLMRQQNYLASVIVTDDVYAGRSDDPVDGLPVYKLAEGSADVETFTLAMASDAALPPPAMVTVLTGTGDLSEAYSFFEEQSAQLRGHEQRIHDLEQQLLDRRELEERLIEAEQGAGGATFPGSVADAWREVAQLTDRLEGTRRILEDVLNSPSWRLTAPLRKLKKQLEDRS
jgi:SAM-dependent methyltransferase